jgi:membrane protein involved in colicin uptake
MANWDAGIMVPLGAFAMTIIIVAIVVFGRMRDRELRAHQELRMREMDHERRMKELEIERLKLEVEQRRAQHVG